MEEISTKLIEQTKTGKCPVCGKQKKEHTRKMLKNCKRSFARRFSTRTQTVTMADGSKVKVNPLSDVHIRRVKKEVKKNA